MASLELEMFFVVPGHDWIQLRFQARDANEGSGGNQATRVQELEPEELRKSGKNAGAAFWLVGNVVGRNTRRMNPIVVIAPSVILIGGVLCFVFLPLPLPIRLAVLITDSIAAGVIGFVLSRRLK